MSTKGASDYLGVNLRTLYRFIDEGDLAAYRFGRVIRLKEEDVVDFVARCRIAPGSLEHLLALGERAQIAPEAVEHLYPDPIRVDGR
jgi:excisionase family DNA binding protein